MRTPTPEDYVWLYTLNTENQIDVYMCMVCGTSVSSPRSIADKIKNLHTKWHEETN